VLQNIGGERKMAKFLIGETEKYLAMAMSEHFVISGHEVQVETSGLQIIECLRNKQFDVIILEIALSGLDGISVVRSYRKTGGDTPILLLTDRHSSDELKHGLDGGADAYLVKPFRLNDLGVHVRALLRRPALRNLRILRMGDVSMDTDAGQVTRFGVPIHLHPMEFKLLRFLMTNPDRVFDAHALFQRVWQKDFGSMEDTVRTHIRTLRKKINQEDRGSKSIITTVRGQGYKASIPVYEYAH
jgi:DNA-binding response OmpR family regulator